MKNAIYSTLTALFLAAILLSSAAMAQNRGGGQGWHDGPPSAEQKLAHISQALGLSDEQAVQMLEIFQASEGERAAIHDRMMEDYRPEICALKQDTEANIASILTAEQLEKFEAMQQDRQNKADRRQNKGKKGRNGPDCQTDDG
jgi:Spy/CpxP family protein refolding chaperone